MLVLLTDPILAGEATNYFMSGLICFMCHFSSSVELEIDMDCSHKIIVCLVET